MAENKNKAKKIHFYRNELITLNHTEMGGKWHCFDLVLYADTLDEMKNKIDDVWGGYAGSKPSKRYLKHQEEKKKKASENNAEKAFINRTSSILGLRF